MDDFLNKLKACSNPNDMPVTMVGPNDHYYIHIYFENLIFCAVLREETCPLMVTEFLHRIKDIFIDYFGVCNVDSIKERFCFTISSVKPFKSKNRDNIYLEAPNSNLKKSCDRDFRATA